MSSLQIGSSDGSHGLTQHGPSQSHLPAPLTSSQTRKRRRVTKSNASAIPTECDNLPQSSATNVDWHSDGTGQIPSSLSLLLDWLPIQRNYDSLKGKGGSKPQNGYKTASAYLKERGCTPSPTSSDIRSKVNGKALPFKSLHCDSSFLDSTPSFGLDQGQRLERWE
ncbi:uncharacterized protein L203_104120 [Cryptococcus depauperatus CBS 7841]|uniref:Uncharacterized protein n=1 Tax=Cryptococcus depauperatus CBS 7841 TaxID=1295531 RepID=A0A1E3IBD6_9TREE|nr:hypothetical protein L203_04429 [Cryptococcus depauperatus CBS 7841]